MAPRYTQQVELRMVHGAATLTDPKDQMSFTVGQGAMTLSGYRLGVLSDHDPFTGSVNPVLGFASGQTFAQAGYKFADNTTVRFGFSVNRTTRQDISPDNTQEVLLQREFGRGSLFHSVNPIF